MTIVESSIHGVFCRTPSPRFCQYVKQLYLGSYTNLIFPARGVFLFQLSPLLWVRWRSRSGSLLRFQYGLTLTEPLSVITWYILVIVLPLTECSLSMFLTETNVGAWQPAVGIATGKLCVIGWLVLCKGGQQHVLISITRIDHAIV